MTSIVNVRKVLAEALSGVRQGRGRRGVHFSRGYCGGSLQLDVGAWPRKSREPCRHKPLRISARFNTLMRLLALLLAIERRVTGAARGPGSRWMPKRVTEWDRRQPADRQRCSIAVLELGHERRRAMSSQDRRLGQHCRLPSTVACELSSKVRDAASRSRSLELDQFGVARALSGRRAPTRGLQQDVPCTRLLDRERIRRFPCRATTA